MTSKERVLAVVPARGGSKGVPGKNIRLAGGKPLIAWTLEAAAASRHVDRVVLSSDDAAIIEVARACGCEVPFVRAPALAADESLTTDVVLDALDRCPGYDWVVLLQPTSPLRTSADIDAAIRLCFDRPAPACVSVCEVEESPYWMFTIDGAGRVSPLLPGAIPGRRQDLPPVYSLNGAVYVARVEWLRERKSFISEETVGLVMPARRSLDIDCEADFQTFQNLMENSNNVSLPPAA